jgi:hypothetical protein
MNEYFRVKKRTHRLLGAPPRSGTAGHSSFTTLQTPSAIPSGQARVYAITRHPLTKQTNDWVNLLCKPWPWAGGGLLGSGAPAGRPPSVGPRPRPGH